MKLSARLKIMSQDVHAQKELWVMHISLVKESLDVNQIVSVPMKRLVLMANVHHPVTVASMLSAL